MLALRERKNAEIYHRRESLQKVSLGIFTFGVMTLAVYISQRYLKRYLKKDIRTKIRYMEMSENHLPAIAILWNYLRSTCFYVTIVKLMTLTTVL